MAVSLLTLKELLEAVDGRIANGASDCVFLGAATDSRLVQEGFMFVPLLGSAQDGHKYVPEALSRGASVILVNESEYHKKKSYYEEIRGAAVVRVENTLTALQKAAGSYVEKFPSMIKVCITGSSGKTTTKELAVAVMKEHFGSECVAHTLGNFNSETGLPLSVLNNIHGKEKAGVFEMGMNRQNEIGEISAVLKARYGIITNIGTAHIGLMGSQENIAREKRKALSYIPSDGAAFVPSDDAFADFCTENVKGKIVKFGKSVPEKESGVRFVKGLGLDGTAFSYEGVDIRLPLAGDYNYQNALGVVALARELGIPAAEIKMAFESMPVVSGRMESRPAVLKNGRKITLIQDCYNANPDSMAKAVDFCSGLGMQVVLVLGDMKELGAESEGAHAAIGVKAASEKPFLTVFAGPEMKAAWSAFKKQAPSSRTEYFCDSSDEKIKEISGLLLEACPESSVLLLKGSHGMALERIVPQICLQEVSDAAI